MNALRLPNIRVMAAAILFPALAYAGAGTTAGIILKETVSARAEAMGGAYTAVAAGPDAVTWNAAGLSLTGARTLSIMYLKGIADTNFATLGYARQYGVGAFGLSVENLSSGNLEINYLDGTSRNVDALHEYVVNLAGAKQWGDVAAGVNLKYLQSTIAEAQSARTVSADAGVLYTLPMVEGVTLGASLQNMFGGLKYDDVEDPLPAQFRAGAAWRRGMGSGSDVLLVTADVNKPRELSTRYNAGIEYAYRGVLALRTGYKFGYDVDGVTAGVGVVVGNYTIDYAFAPRGELGNNHRLSLSVEF